MNPSLMIILIIMISSFIIGCSQNPAVIVKKDPCKIPGSFCYDFKVDGGTTNISFPNASGTFNYVVED